jgi:hypothetical protein
MNGLLRTFTPVLAALAASALAAPAAVADPVPDAVPIRPNTFFTATVNPNSAGTAAEPVIKVVCPGPVTPNETGHPVAGQSVEVQEVLPPGPATLGFTGSAGTSIDAHFSAPSAATANPPIVLTAYFVPVQIPTSFNLPCGGEGTVSFVPNPTSPTARSVAVKVLFLNIAV